MTPRELVDIWYANTDSKCWLSLEARTLLSDAITLALAAERERCAKFCENFNPESYLAKEIRTWK